MAQVFKCDFCGRECDHAAQLTQVDRMSLPGRPTFGEIYPDMQSKEVCRDCCLAEDKAFRAAKPEIIKLVRHELDKRRSN